MEVVPWRPFGELSSLETFFVSITENKSLYWVDIVRPDLPRLEKFMSPLRLHPQIMENTGIPLPVPISRHYGYYVSYLFGFEILGKCNYF